MNKPSNSGLRHLWFECAGKCFAVTMDQLQEVLPAPAIRPLPGAEPALAGLMILRDQVLPVFDPMALLGLLAEKVGQVVHLPVTVSLTVPARLAEVFAAEADFTGLPRLLVLDAEALATTMGLIEKSIPLGEPIMSSTP